MSTPQHSEGSAPGAQDDRAPASAETAPEKAPWWSSVKIRTKLAIILLIPALTLTAMVGVRLVESAAEASAAAETTELVGLIGEVSAVIQDMQAERLAAAMIITGENTGFAEASDLQARFQEARQASGDSLDTLAETREAAGQDLDTEMFDLLERVDRPIGQLEVARRAVADGSVSEVHLTVYDSVVARLSAILDRAVDVTGSADLSSGLRAASLLLDIDETSEQMHLLVLGLQHDRPLAEKYRPFVGLVADREESLSEYRRLIAGTDLDEEVSVVGGLGGGDARPANRIENQVAGGRPDEPQDIDHEALAAAYSARHAATAGLLDDTIERTGTTAAELRESVVQRLVLEGAIAVAAMAIAVLIALGLSRSVTRGLRGLSASARQVAMVDLPQTVKSVDDQEGLGGLTPFEFAARTTPPLRTRGSDELAEVGEAFNIVHREAVRISAQQALLRHHVGAIFVRLARRGHSLTGRLTSELDEAERNEQDPDRLQRLFRLDHLVSLIGRTNDSLLVLGGASAAKVRVAQAKFADVLTAAQSRIEYYTRVELAAEDGAWVKAEAVDDVVQLLAELMDNATRYSESSAEVSARVLTGRVVVQIRDHGIGIDPERTAQLNDRLRRRVPVDLEAMRAMGLTVVGHLAARHGIEVELRPSIGGGTVAEVAVPGSILSFTEPESAPARPSAIAAGNAAPPPDPLNGRRNAPLFEQSAASRPAPSPARGVAAVDTRPAPQAIEGPTEVLARLPQVRFDVGYAEPSLLAGAALPQAQEEVATYTEGGLPVRQPMSNLVPGAVASTRERPDEPVRRDPRTIGATYSAYARGLSGTRSKTHSRN